MKFDVPLKLTHGGWNRLEEEPYKRVVAQPDMVLEGLVLDDDNHHEEDMEETV